MRVRAGARARRAVRRAGGHATALFGQGWAEGKVNPPLFALVRGDRAKLVSMLVEVDGGTAELGRVEGFARWAGLAEDPAFVKAIADRKAQYAA